MEKLLKKEMAQVKRWEGPRMSGRVTHVIGLLIESMGPDAYVGELCYIYGRHGEKIPCHVVGFKNRKVLLMSLSDVNPIAVGAEVFPTREEHCISVSKALCGRILNAMGDPIDGKGELLSDTFYPVTAPPPPPLSRQPINEVLPTGIKAIDALSTVGRGQRIGIFSGPGGGKSTLMAKIAKTAQADINVIALIGERGREVREFIENELGPEGLARSVVVVATSDQTALLRSKGANVATAIAEYFRDLGHHVILMMDSISRYAMALREIGLAIGEPPTTQGYTPSVFAQLPRLLERAGNSKEGSITGIYTILCEEEKWHDPISNQMHSLLDGHLHLSQELAHANHFPPIDVLRSLSRVMGQVTDEKQQEIARRFRSLLHAYKEAEELIHLGAYVSGSNTKIDEAIAKREAISAFLTQKPTECFSFEETLCQFQEIFS
ncbi:MAG: FliI/YscN family ATPase [Chlamydiales bacterium]